MRDINSILKEVDIQIITKCQNIQMIDRKENLSS